MVLSPELSFPDKHLGVPGQYGNTPREHVVDVRIASLEVNRAGAAETSLNGNVLFTLSCFGNYPSR